MNLIRRCLACAGLITASVLFSSPAVADDDCTWLPDLRCDDRVARLPDFVPPVSGFVHFEDPFITTGITLWGIWHDFPEASVFSGGDARAVAVQVRVALTDRLGLIATKDGRISIRPDNPLLDTEVGYGDWGFGLKYALIQSEEPAFVLTPSLRYETTNGSVDALQGNGDGLFIPALSAALKTAGFQWIGGVGMRLPVDGNAESQSLFYHLNVSRPLTAAITPFVEFNGISYVDSGDGTTELKLGGGARLGVDAVTTALALDPFEGHDVANLGSGDVEGDDVLSAAIGVRVALREHVSLGLAYERPITKRRHILKQRVSLSLAFEY